MPRRLGEDRPPRAVRGGGRYAANCSLGCAPTWTRRGKTLLHIGQVEGADCRRRGEPSNRYQTGRHFARFCCLVDRDFGLMLVLMMPHVLHLGCRAFVLAVSCNRRPAELER